MVPEFLLFVFFAQFEVAFFEFELADGELVVLFCAVGFGLFALAALFFALLVALIAGDCVGFFLSLAFFALLFADDAAGCGVFFAQFAGSAGVGALDDAEHSDDLVVGFDLGGFRETGEGVDHALDGGDLEDDNVVVRDALNGGIIGSELCEDRCEFGLVELKLRINGTGGVVGIGQDGGEEDGIDVFGRAVWFEVGFEELGRGIGEDFLEGFAATGTRRGGGRRGG